MLKEPALGRHSRRLGSGIDPQLVDDRGEMLGDDAFMAGEIVGVIDRDTTSHPRFRAKLDGIDYGFVVPVFFITSGMITSGMQLNLHALVANPAALLRVPTFLLALLIVRGIPAVLYLRAIGVWASAAAALLRATSLPVIVTVAQIGVVLGALLPVNTASLICSGLLSTLIFPAAGLAVLHRRGPDDAEPHTA